MSGIRRFTKDADSLAEGNVILIIYLAFADPKPLQWGFFYLWICGKRILKLRRENLIETILRWLIGLAFSLLIGHFVTNLFVTKLRRYLNLDEQWIVENVDFGHRFIPPLLMGTLERLFFLILIPEKSARVMFSLKTELRDTL